MALSEKKREAIKRKLKSQRGPKGQGVHAPKAIEAAYFKDLSKIVLRTAKMVKTEIGPLLKKAERDYVADAASPEVQVKAALDGIRKQLQKDLDKIAKKIAARRMAQTEKVHKAQFIADLNSAIGVNLAEIVTDEGIAAIVKAQTRASVSLIKSLPRDQLRRIESIILQGLENQTAAFNIQAQLIEATGIDVRRARLIATDQIQKLTGNLSKTRQNNLGIKHYIWRDVGDAAVRPDHQKRNGKRYPWNKSPIPGEPVRCRCVASPDYSDLKIAS